MAKTFFTADTHFGCRRTLTLRKRPFASIEAMDAAMVANWNATVAPADEVWHLGDVAHRAHDRLAALLGGLNGRLNLILGNNDDPDALAATGRFASIAEMRELPIGGQTLFLCHYPLREWPNAWRGAWHAFGHVHGKFDRDPLGLSLDVGVDTHGYAPIAFEAIAAEMDRRTAPRAAAASRAP